MRPIKHNAVRIALISLITYCAVKICVFMNETTKIPVKNKYVDFNGEPSPCKMHSCFNYSLCSLKSGFPVYVYKPLVHPDDAKSIKHYLKIVTRNPHVITKEETKTPCLYIVTIYEGNNKNSHLISAHFNSTFHIEASSLKNLAYWGKDGRNHLIINLSANILGMDKYIGMAMVAQPTFTEAGFRPGFDIIMPTIWPPKIDEDSFCPPIKPALRRYLLSFQGSRGHGHNIINEIILETKLNSSLADKIFIQLECFVTNKNQASVNIMDWALCNTAKLRRSVLEKSTFVLMTAPVYNYVTTGIFHLRLYEALMSGAIPVILGGDRVRLPFDEVLDWRRATLMIPEVRVSELIYLLNSINEDDLLEFRQQGRKLWMLYFSSLKGSMDSVLAIIRSRLMIPPPPISPVKARPGFNTSFTPPKVIVSHPVINQYVGEIPTTPMYLKQNFRRNLTITLLQGYKLWNDWGEPFKMFPQLPWDPVPEEKEKFIDSNSMYLDDGNKKSLAVVEKFTIIISTYKRQSCLQKMLLKLRGLAYLDKVVVVWNDRLQPASMTWPDVGVPVLVIRPSENYQQNRFKPYYVIETDAVYFQDDDVMIRHFDIISAFRIWRENRDRIVGFFARYHIGYQYYTEISNLTSMISTGAAFIHRYYLWAYWRFLPAAITEHVDIVGKCEDMAMNFLIAHITKKPPIQVPFNELKSTCTNHRKKKKRHKYIDYCLEYFSKIMGYTPLLYTELVVDTKASVAYQTSSTTNSETPTTEKCEISNKEYEKTNNNPSNTVKESTSTVTVDSKHVNTVESNKYTKHSL